MVLHPFTFDTADVPTGVTSVTLARKLRIDAIVYQCQRLELVPRDGGGRLGRPSRKLWMKMIENGKYPKNDQFFRENEVIMKFWGHPIFRQTPKEGVAIDGY